MTTYCFSALFARLRYSTAGVGGGHAYGARGAVRAWNGARPGYLATTFSLLQVKLDFRRIDECGSVNGSIAPLTAYMCETVQTC